MKRMLILDLSTGIDIYKMIHGIIEDNKLSNEIEIALHRKRCERHLPTGFDLYLIHFSDTSDEALDELKSEQPWCNIFLISGASYQILKPSLADDIFYIVDYKDIRDMLDKIGISIPESQFDF